MKRRGSLLTLAVLLVVGLSPCLRAENNGADGMDAPGGAAAATPLLVAEPVDVPMGQEEITKLIETLGYPNEVAASFSSTVDLWKDDRQHSLIPKWKKALDDARAEHEAGRLLDRTEQRDGENCAAPLALPALEATLKCSHLFNVLEARGALSVTERAASIQRIRRLACRVAAAHLAQRKAAGFPLLERCWEPTN